MRWGESCPPGKEFKDPDANSALAAADAATAKAKVEYDKAIIAAKTKLIAELEKAQVNATKSGDLDEAVKLRDSIVALKAEIAKPPATATATTAPAQKVNPVVGIWWVAWGLDAENATGGEHIELLADGTSKWIKRPELTGHWSIANGKLTIRWSNGSSETYYKFEKDRMIGGTPARPAVAGRVTSSPEADKP